MRSRFPSPARTAIVSLLLEPFQKLPKRHRGGMTVRQRQFGDLNSSAAERHSVRGPAQDGVAGGEIAQADGDGGVLGAHAELEALAR